jgi:2-keto-3-deoxy-L-rhamnonate aldolase RhmA
MSARVSVKQRLASGETLGAVWLSLGSAAIAEFAAAAGVDLIVIDRQHGLWDRASLEAAIGVARETSVLVRVADHAPTSISEALDAGVEGVIAPLVESAEQARAIVAAARFPPDGARSGGGVRPLKDFVAYVERARRETIVGVMIETRAGVERASEIAAVEGVDFVFIGMGDLSLSLDEFPAPGPRHAAALVEILAACRRAKKPCGAFTGSAEAAARRAREGFSLVTVASDVDLMREGIVAATRGFAQAFKQTRELPKS